MQSQADAGATGANVGNLPETFTWNSLYASENTNDTEAWVSDAKDSFFVKWLTGHLENDRPIMVEWGDWGGYYFYPLERWFGMWNDRNIAPKPYQLQPFVVVDVMK